jgi:hypothetical protein
MSGDTNFLTMPNSIHDHRPIAPGGVPARVGFAYQDWVAVGFCVDVVADSTYAAVWCEINDDITLITNENGQDCVEFIQIKNERRDSLWSVANITYREDEREGASIVERSLSHDCYREPCSFRIISSADIRRELRLLEVPIGHPSRSPSSPEFNALLQQLDTRLPGVLSTNQNGLSFWLSRTRWEVRGDESSLISSAQLKLTDYLHEIYGFSAPDQVKAVVEMLAQLVKRAGDSLQTEEKKLREPFLRTEINRKVQDLRRPAAHGSPLRAALCALAIPDADIESIILSHRRCKREWREQPYLAIEHDFERIREDVESLLARLRLAFISGEYSGTALQFHQRCIEQIDVYYDQHVLADGFPRRESLYSIMYEQVERGVHYFWRDLAA